MGSKSEPSKFDCYGAADDDEPMFVLLGRDPLAPSLVRMWADLRELTRGPSEKVDEARSLAEWMEDWQRAQGT